MKVRAKAPCNHAGSRRRVGDVFDYELAAGEKLPPYLEAVAEGVPVGRAPRAPAGPPETDTLSEMARRGEPRPKAAKGGTL